jgi:hypothetical protein
MLCVVVSSPTLVSQDTVLRLNDYENDKSLKAIRHCFVPQAVINLMKFCMEQTVSRYLSAHRAEWFSLGSE